VHLTIGDAPYLLAIVSVVAVYAMLSARQERIAALFRLCASASAALSIGIGLAVLNLR